MRLVAQLAGALFVAFFASRAAAQSTAFGAPESGSRGPIVIDMTQDGLGESGSLMLCIGAARSLGQQAASFSARGLAGYLGEQMGGTIATSLYPDSEALAEALASGRLDAAWLPPMGYVRAAERARVKAVARLTRHGATTYRSVIFVRADSPVRTVDDLKGRSVVWGGPTSASGRLFPRAHLRKLGKDPDQLFEKQATARDHREICQMVLDGTVDAGASISDETAKGASPIVDGCREAGFDPAKFLVVDRSDPIPNDVIAVRQGFPPKLEERLRNALMAMTATTAGRQNLQDVFRADGFSAVADKDFAAVREARKLEKK